MWEWCNLEMASAAAGREESETQKPKCIRAQLTDEARRHTSYTIKCGVHSNEQINPPYCCTVRSNWKMPTGDYLCTYTVACAREATYRRRWLIAIENYTTPFYSDSMCWRAVQPGDSMHLSRVFSLSPFSFLFLTFSSLYLPISTWQVLLMPAADVYQPW